MARLRSPGLRRWAWRAETVGYDLLTLVARLLPIDFVSACGGMLLARLGPFSSAHRTARRNLHLAFPEMSAPAKDKVLKEQWANFGRYLAEFPILDRLTEAAGRVQVVGAERLAEIAKGGLPVVFISGHFSNLEVMAAVILAAGIECDITYRAANNPLIDARIRKSRLRYGVRLFAPKGEDGARELLEALKSGRSVAMMNDQKYDAGVAAPFFGRPVMTLPAAVRLALRFGAVIQPMSIERRRGARFVCFVHEPIVPVETGRRSADILAGVVAINAFLEGRVRARPGEWWWMHRRWPKEVYEELAAQGL
ncbi:MAG: lysophospholipid acyltransferase family protein [Caulobacteraceae bacterium]